MRIVVYKNDGNGPIQAPVMIWEEHEGQTAEEIFSMIDPSLEPVIMERESLPTYQEFFMAWEFNNGSVDINIEKAKDITKQRLRMERTPLLAELDVQFQRALEDGSDTKDIVDKKKALRDVTIHADLLNASTPEELKSLTLDNLI